MKRLSYRGGLIIRILVHIFAALPLIWLFLAVDSGHAGGDPVQYIIHFLGKGALNCLVLCLLITPVARWSKQGQLMQLRRPLGLWSFTYACCHLTAYISLDLLFTWQLVGEEIVKRPYLLIGMMVWLILLALALTSFKSAQRKMGRNWQMLHNFVYAALVLGVIHYYWSVKSEVIEPSIYVAIAILLLLFRAKVYKYKWRKLLFIER